MKKICRVCNKELLLESFGVLNGFPDGRNPRCKLCVNRYMASWRLEHLDVIRERDRNRWQKRRDTTLRRKYGLGIEEFNEILKNQGGVCAICGRVESGSNGWGRYENLHVDHVSESGAIRGLLCFHCNTGIGHFNHDPDVLRIAITYLEASMA